MRVLVAGDYLAPPLGAITALDIEDALVELALWVETCPRILTLADLLRPEPHSC